MKTPIIVAAVASLLATNLSAQRLTVDVRAAVAVPTSEVAEADLSTGFGFGGVLAWRLQQHLHVYGGWDWMRFASDEGFAGNSLDFEETGYTLGLRFEHPLGAASRTMYRLEGGATFKHVEVENDDGDLIADTDHGVGFEVGAGLLLPLSGDWKLAPTLRYRSLSRDYTIGVITRPGDLRYGALELGLSRRF